MIKRNLLILIIGLFGIAGAQTTLSLDPTSVGVNVGQTFTVQVQVNDVIDLYSYQVYLSFDTTYLEFQNASPGGFLGSGTFFFYQTDTIVNEREYFWVVETKLGAVPGSSGSGILTNIEFLAKTLTPPEGTEIRMEDSGQTILLDSYGNFIPCSISSGICTVNVVLQVTNLSASPDTITVEVGDSFALDFNISNVTGLFSYQEKFFYDPSLLKVTNCIPGPFLSENGQYQTFFISGGDTAAGWFTFAETRLGTNLGASGSGTLATCSLYAKTAGETPITIDTSSTLYDINGQEISYTTTHGLVIIQEGGIEEEVTLQKPESENLKLRVYPNPFRSVLRISYIVGRDEQNVTLRVYDLSGRLVRDFSRPTTYHLLSSQIIWSGDDDSGCKLPAGVYFILLKTEKETITKKVIRSQ